MDISDFHIIKATGGLQKDMQTVFIWDEGIKHYIYVHFSVDLDKSGTIDFEEFCAMLKGSTDIAPGGRLRPSMEAMGGAPTG